MLDLHDCNVMEELDKELASDVHLVAGESLNGDENGRVGNDEGVDSVNPRRQEESDLDGLRVRWGHVGKVHKRERSEGRTWKRRGSDGVTVNVENN